MERETTCCFTGHRPDKLPWRDDEWDPRCVALKERLAAALEDAYNKGMRHFICGMARGADFYFCEAVLALRERRPGVTVEAALPCEEQAAHWKERDRNRYFGWLPSATMRPWSSTTTTGAACSAGPVHGGPVVHDHRGIRRRAGRHHVHPVLRHEKGLEVNILDVET